MKDCVDNSDQREEQSGQGGRATPVQQIVRIDGDEMRNHLVAAATDELRRDVKANGNDEDKRHPDPIPGAVSGT